MAANKFIINDAEVHVNRWNSVIDLWHQERNCDLEFICKDDQTIKAHRVVLVSSGFDIVVNDQNKGKIFIDIPLEIMTRIIKYCYNGKLEIAASELQTVMVIFASLNAQGLYDEVENYFARNIEVVPQDEFNKMSVSCLRSISSKCPEIKKDFWLKVFLQWSQVDETRKGDFFILIQQLSTGLAINDGFEHARNNNVVTQYDNSYYMAKQKTYENGVPFYFSFMEHIYMSYNGSNLGAAEGFPNTEAQDIIMISAQGKKYLEILQNKSLIIRDGDNRVESEYKVDGYCLNPPLLILSDNRVMKVLQNRSQNGSMFQHIPQLSAVIPKITQDTPQCIEFIDAKYILLRDNSITKYSKMCVLSESGENEWKDIGIDRMEYIDVDDGGQLFGVQYDDDGNESTYQMQVVDGKLQQGITHGTMKGNLLLFFISSWGSVVNRI